MKKFKRIAGQIPPEGSSYFKRVIIRILITAGFAVILHPSAKSADRGTEMIKRAQKEINRKSSLWKYIDSLPVIDTHEHIASEEELLGRNVDVFSLFTPYLVDNLQSAGMPDDQIRMLGNPETDFSRKWEIFQAYYPLIKHTTYYKALKAALEHQYNLQTVSSDEFKRISDLLKKEYSTRGFMQKIMNINKIESVLTYRQAALREVRKTYGENRIFVVPTVSDLTLKNKQDLRKFSAIFEQDVATLDDIIQGTDKLFREYNGLGIKNIKFGSAYNRRLNYTSRTKEEAERAFNEIMEPRPANPNLVEARFLTGTETVLDDYITFHMITLAQKYNMNVIFHMGLAAWNYNTVKNSHASDLEWLIQMFPKVNFVILHSGYPFFEEGILLAKYYPNVYLNMTWDHIIERDRSVEAMKSYIEMLPLNKIHLFGGDYIYPQQICGNMLFTKENLYITLSELIERKRISEDDAREIALYWLYKNPRAFYLGNEQRLSVFQ